MDADLAPLRAKPTSIPVMPENIWLAIFDHLSLKDLFKVSGTCRAWRRIIADPSLYTDLVLDQMEFNTLIQCLQQLCRLAPRIRSLRIAHCYSNFISTTTVPLQTVPLSHHCPQQQQQPAGMMMHTLYTHITSFTLPRRREEYRKLGFTLHQDFSTALVALMEQSQDSILRLEIQNNFLDLEMTELIFCIVRYGRNLKSLLYDANRENTNSYSFVAPEVVSAIIAACPSIQSFRGQHAISDTVLRQMMTGWEDLTSVTLAPYQSPSTMGTKEISLEGFWSLLVGGKIETLELLDLECISNENMRDMMQRVKQLESLSLSLAMSGDHPMSPLAPNHPFAHLASHFAAAAAAQPQPSAWTITGGSKNGDSERQHDNHQECSSNSDINNGNGNNNSNNSTGSHNSNGGGNSGSSNSSPRPLPGASVRHLTVTKYTSSPLTLPGFSALLKLFPNLRSMRFTTNFFTYDHQFHGLTPGIFEQEIGLVNRMVLAEMADRWSPEQAASCWIAEWHAAMTEEQRLRAGVMQSSLLAASSGSSLPIPR
ncbi:hypothetical protein BGZ99_007689 [Dissophora globulifera]|uniref:F-box domain-containing protein n=1 Tax=Dissophora globulifera TaxID=979702 RepID=A0A9P6R936_9FUNG|nr:hypothetical protein BGZ99_007689 [Dissophora globulifera]